MYDKLTAMAAATPPMTPPIIPPLEDPWLVLFGRFVGEESAFVTSVEEVAAWEADEIGALVDKVVDDDEERRMEEEATLLLTEADEVAIEDMTVEAVKIALVLVTVGSAVTV